MAMVTVQTPHGTFRMGRLTIGVSVYRATRSLRINGRSVKPGDHFALGHRMEKIMRMDPCLKIYGGEFVGRYHADGTKTAPNNPAEACENDTMSW